MTHLKDACLQISQFSVFAGVRISAFVSSDEKQPLQKSIVGFLNSGKAEPGPSHREIPRYQNDQHSGSSKLWPLLRQRSGEAEEKTTLEEPQQSFFQRAHAKRLQLQAAAASSRQEDSSGISSPPLLDARDCAALDEPDNDRACGASTSSSDGVGLSCPVCFRRVETADLAVFNRHIDQCLSVRSAQKPSQHLEQSDGREAKKAESSGGLNGISPAEERGLGSTSAETASSVIGNDPKSSSLVCPICLLTQDNDDLIMFNRHVDLCLNQGVLHKLQSETRSPINPPSAPNCKALGEFVRSEEQLDRCSKANPENVANLYNKSAHVADFSLTSFLIFDDCILASSCCVLHYYYSQHRSFDFKT